MGVKLKNIPVTMDHEFVAEIDRVAKEMKESRSLVMRSALRYGLPLLKSRGAADVVQLDGELSAEVGRIADRHDLPRQKVLIESVRAGLGSAHARLIAEWAARSQTGAAIETPELAAAILMSPKDANPLAHDLIISRSRERSLQQLLTEVESDPEGAKIVDRIRVRLKKSIDRDVTVETGRQAAASSGHAHPQHQAPEQHQTKPKARDKKK